jgi:hypothetical protein
MRLISRKLRIWLILGIVVAGALISGFLLPAGEEEHGFEWTHFPGFYAILGFLGCVAIIYLAKWLGHLWLQKKEDYYD